MKFSQRAQAISPFYAMAFGEKASRLEAQGHHVIKLNIGEPDFGAPEPVINAMHECLKHSLPYTSALGLPQLRSAIAQFYSTTHNVRINPERVIVTAGASAALLLVSAALVNPGDEVIMADPAYPCNRQFINTFGGRVNLVPTTVETHFQLNTQLTTDSLTSNTRGIMLATPSNPTGTSITNDELERLCQWAKAKGLWCVVDEIYLNLTDRSVSPEPKTALSFNDDAIVINSFSKYFGMTGWRLGWCIVPDKMVSVMESLAQNLYICPSAGSQYAALACFEPETLAICEQRRDTLSARRKLILAGLQDTGLTVPVAPDGAFYVYIDISASGLDAMTFCDRLLSEHYVALTPGDDFGENKAQQFVRLSFAANEQALQIGLKRIAQFMATLDNPL